MKKNLLALMAFMLFVQGMRSYGQWQLTGNSNATAASKLGTTNAIPLYLYTNNVARLSVTAAGRVGVGLTAPPNIFSVKGSGGTPAASWVNSGAPLFTGFGEQTLGNADYVLALASTLPNARPVFIGRRGRGTLAAPGAVSNNDYLMSFLSSGYDGSAFQNTAAIDFYVDGVPSAGNLPARISFVTGSTSTNRAERLKITSTGDVRVATGNLLMGSALKTIQFSNPLTNSPAMMTMFDSGTGNHTRMVISHSPAYPNWGLQYADSLDQFDFLGAGNSALSIPLYGGTISTPDALTTGGPVSVNGPALAGYALNVNASTSYSGINVTDPVDNYILYSNKTGLYAGIYVNKSAINTGTACFQGSATGSAIGIQATTHTGIALYGTSDSSYGVYGYNTSGNTYAGYFTGNVYTTGTYQSSDERLKKNITDFSNAMDILNTLKPKHYEFKNDGNYAKLHLPTGTHYGLIAQDLEKVLPELVKDASINSSLLTKTEGGKEPAKGQLIDFKAVNYVELIPILVKGMQELSNSNATKDAQINDLEARLTRLETMMNGGKPMADAKQQGISLTSASLEQNVPNPPVNNTTKISYNIPNGTARAEMVITDNFGKKVKQLALTNSGKGILNVDTNGLASGTYSYTLYVDGKIVETKKMVIAAN